MCRRVIDRSLNYHRRFLPEQFVFENEREWSSLIDLCESRGNPFSLDRPKYLFSGIIESLAEEWLHTDLLVGNLKSLGNDPVAVSLNAWIS